MLCNNPNCEIEEPFISQWENCDMMTHRIAVPSMRTVSSFKCLWISGFSLNTTRFSTHLLSKNTHLSDQFVWMLCCYRSCRVRIQNPISRFRTSFNLLNRWRNSFDWFSDGGGRPEKIYVIENIMSSSERILDARPINVTYNTHIRVASIWK